jgi:hypothetical protein
MKTKIKIPKGWKKLGKGTFIKRGDKWFDCSNHRWNKSVSVGERVGFLQDIYIRKISF